ncbi:hypothetical protein G4X40_10110 [Rhodococcus sp. D2-41]|uniref:Uncharacterized protein n=1 Tax=Speluncibacter jeojiensis TaxID=2710754 RepID=A0A9X4LXK7_9ACTN|nr:hypothetical protein [Rhodococcus sp. D2-41]MDG3010500.1 hypothetical protein [Rhodococcus sp. D2-41]MDG3014248.1 hypothetical protein [Corynebacteriales bacterium D3-21]
MSTSFAFRSAVVVAAGAAALLVGAGQASADVAPGSYTSTTTTSSGIVLLQRTGSVQGQDLVLIGRYPIHPTPTGGYVDFFPGHRVVMNSDGHGGYTGPAYLGGVVVGSITLTPQG